jgi:hypothetical protein
MTPEEIQAGLERWLKYHREQQRYGNGDLSSGFVAMETLLNELRDCGAEGVWPWNQQHVLEGM